MSKRIKVLTGTINCGKTTYAAAMVMEKRSSGRLVGGILSRAFWDKGVKRGFYFEDILTGKRILLCAERGYGGEEFKKSGGPDTGRFFFNPNAFLFAETSLLAARRADIIIIDELGRLEAGEKGLYSVTKRLIDEFDGELVLVIRRELVEDILNVLHVERHLIDTISLD
jgi:nucleoside-triphosphatase